MTLTAPHVFDSAAFLGSEGLGRRMLGRTKCAPNHQRGGTETSEAVQEVLDDKLPEQNASRPELLDPPRLDFERSQKIPGCETSTGMAGTTADKAPQ
jgi:hypothetical protein